MHKTGQNWNIFTGLFDISDWNFQSIWHWSQSQAKKSRKMSEIRHISGHFCESSRLDFELNAEKKWINWTKMAMNQCNENDKRLFEHCKRNVDPSKFGVVMFVLFVIYLTDLISTNQEEKWWMTTTAASAWPSGELFQTPLLKSHFQWLKFNSTSPQ